jgi:hypothetical protein
MSLHENGETRHSFRLCLFSNCLISKLSIQKFTIARPVNLLFKIEYLCDCMTLKNGFVLYGNLFSYGTNDVYRE